MARTLILSRRHRMNVWILQSQNEELERVCEAIGKTKTDAVGEAIRYWLSAQYRMGVK